MRHLEVDVAEERLARVKHTYDFPLRGLEYCLQAFGLESLEAVLCELGDEVDPDILLEGISELVDHSLVRRLDGGGDEARFGMLATIQEYGLEKLAAAGERATARHACR